MAVTYGVGALKVVNAVAGAHAEFSPIVAVFNNRGCSRERFILDGPFNNISDWKCHRLGEVFGRLYGYDTPTEEDFETALGQARAHADRPTLINVHLDPREPSPAMQRLTSHLRNQV